VLVLASSSRYRRELLERLRIAFVVSVPEVDERALGGEAPLATALRLAELKAHVVARQHSGCVVIGSDQVAELDGQPIGKPGDHIAALDQLMAMRARTVVFHTAVCVVDGVSGRTERQAVPTTVRFRAYTAQQAARYLSLDRPYDCAGSAKIEALGIALVESVESSDPTALVGLPLIALVAMLERAGVEIL
jgi:septum formation protein